MPGILPFQFPAIWDVAVISGRSTPGVVAFKKASRPYRWDEKDGPGLEGATQTYRGRKIPHFDMVVKLWTDALISDWIDFATTVLWIDPQVKTVTALDIAHPALSILAITSICVHDIGQLEHDGGGLWTCTVELSEFRPPPKANGTSTPGGSKKTNPKAPGKQDPSAQDAQDAEIKRLYNQLTSAP